MISSATTASRVRAAAVVAIACAYAAAITYGIVLGPTRYATSEQAADAIEDAESRAVCGRLGVSPGADGYAACASELAGVRQRREERVHRRGDAFF